MQAQLSDPLDKTPVPLQTRATRAALLVDYMNNSKSIQRAGANASAPFHAIKFWSIGNEPDLLINPDTGRRYTVAEYTQAFITYSLAMHQRDPTIKIFGPEISQYTETGGPKDRQGIQWMKGFLNGIGAYQRTHNLPFQLLNGVSFHRYPFNGAQSDVNSLLSNATEWNTIVPSLRQLVRQTLGEDLPVAVTEINSNAGNGTPPQNLAALWWAETLGQLMNNQVEYVAFFSTEGVDSPYPLFTQNGLTETAMLRMMQLFAQLQHNVVPLQDTQGPVSIYATQDGEHNTTSLLLINKTNESQRVNVQAAGILPFSQWQSANLTIQAYGMVVLTLHRGGSDEAFSFSNQVSSQQAVPDVQHVVCGSNTSSTLVC
jgi:Glycoside hydrolase family 44